MSAKSADSKKPRGEVSQPAKRATVVSASLQLFLLFFVTGCVYFNGIYNAKEAAGHGDARLKRGDEGGASTFFSTSSTSAESVLVRFPKSKWRSRALYLAGRGAAMAGFCERGIERLDEYLATAPADSDSNDIDRARLARAMCDLRSSKIDSARVRLDSLIDVKDKETSRQARLWASRAALAVQDGAAAERYLEGMEIGTMAWELLNASVSSRDYVRVESLLVRRAAEADYREDVIGALRELLNAGRFESADLIVSRFDAARVRDNGRVAMHYLVGDYSLRSGRDSLAQRHLVAARQLAGRDTTSEREAAARLTLIQMRRSETMRDADSAYSRQDSAVMRTAFARRLSEQLLFVRLLAERQDTVGAPLFIAAEAARDSLLANPLARSLFLQLAREYPLSPLAPSAMYAALLLMPDSADSYRKQILEQHQGSHVAAWLRGEDPALRSDFDANQEILRSAWQDAIRMWADTLRKIRASQAAAARASGQAGQQ